jgi:glutamine amidotransferase
MQKLKDLELVELLKTKSLEQKVPTLGICLGAQLMCLSSEEGTLPGLGWINAQVKRLPSMKNGSKYKVPHMGWDPVKTVKASYLTDSLSNPRFYFVHSYYIDCQNSEDKLLQNEYSVVFDSAFEKGNIMGVQFHPEKSHRFGKQLLQNFFQHYQ